MVHMDTAYEPLPDDRPVRWGMLATGSIAHTVADDLALIPDDATLVAVGSRSQEHAQEFADRHHAPHAYGSYEELAHDPDVDVIHIATPHSLHADAARLCIEAGKHVLVEKPLTDNPGQHPGAARPRRGAPRLLHGGHVDTLQPAHPACRRPHRRR